MDPISHAAFGGAWSQARAPAAKIFAAAICGVVGAVAPDLDGLIQSSADPLLVLEVHRQFAHSLAFAPLGAALSTAACWRFVRARLTVAGAYAACLLGYLSHELLDACTAWGTQLFWPFSSVRIAWNVIAVFDPLFTAPVLALAAAARWQRRADLARAALLFAALYLALGVVQHERAVRAAGALAASRGHEPVRLVALPAFSSLTLWKTIYEFEGRYYVDAARTAFRAETFTGRVVAKLDIARDFPWLDERSQQARDVERFRTIANGFIAVDPEAPARIVDLRYSLVPNEIAGFWAIVLDPAASAAQHVVLLPTREQAPAQARRLLDLLVSDPARAHNR
jgi:inner membrane protein